MKTGLILAVLSAATLSLSAVAADYQVGDRLEKPKAGVASTYRSITFDDLMPLDWDPNAALKDLDLSSLQDNDPRANTAMAKIRAAWDQAPVVPQMSGQKVRIAGFLVRLEGDDKFIREFLLVPYFGACVHVPAPPVNQVVHVVPAKPVPVGPDMSAVWVKGTMSVTAAKTDLGDAAYRIDAVEVEPYRE